VEIELWRPLFPPAAGVRLGDAFGDAQIVPIADATRMLRHEHDRHPARLVTPPLRKRQKLHGSLGQPH